MTEELKIIADFLTNNSVSIIFITLIIICRASISNFISRLTSLSFKNGSSSIGMEASKPTDNNNLANESASSGEHFITGEVVSQAEVHQDMWFRDMHLAFSEGRVDDAERIFKKHWINEVNDIERLKDEAMYLYFRFEKAKDNSAIDKLKELTKKAETDESKYDCLSWLSFCYRDSMDYSSEVKLWQSALESILSEEINMKVFISLIYALDHDKQSIKSKEMLIEKLKNTKNITFKGMIYSALSRIEGSLENMQLSVFCKDKSVEFDLYNRSDLFDSAYIASEENYNAISISNYIKLVNIDSDNSNAINNLGVIADRLGLQVKAVDNYKMSSSYDNTLAMANQGYLLLNAGFTADAEEIVSKALQFENPHNNIHALIIEINKKKELQEKEWSELKDKSLEKQRLIRQYTEQYYLGSPNDLEGNWLSNQDTVISIMVENEKIHLSWKEEVGGKYNVELIGEVFGASFKGRFIKKAEKNNTLLSFNSDIDMLCFGYFYKEEKHFILFSPEIKNDFLIVLSKISS
ncbi:tetratricopeptide repeat protein [Providencia vermicola]|uniref:tetratricopeptide repeat protein n=1 Tax=Providencia vermicola TaxID=333965 RepID=UPI001CED6D55|nr:hypothetical protein [Providencia vermicola]